MTLQTFLARLEREQRKARRQRVRANVRAYRGRKQMAGYRRIELFISERDYKALRVHSLLLPGESLSAVISRLLTGNRESVEKVQ